MKYSEHQVNETLPPKVIQRIRMELWKKSNHTKNWWYYSKVSPNVFAKEI